MGDGKVCDAVYGPCACGATHLSPVPGLKLPATPPEPAAPVPCEAPFCSAIRSVGAFCSRHAPEPDEAERAHWAVLMIRNEPDVAVAIARFRYVLAAAEARGRERGLEEAAMKCEAERANWSHLKGPAIGACARRIRALRSGR